MEKVRLEIKDVAYKGKGVARMDNGCVVFVPDTLPGETVEARIVKKKKKFAEAELVNIIKPSTHRIEPGCDFAKSGKCPGCCYQHVEYKEELRLKQKQFSDLMLRIGKLDVTEELLPPTASPETDHYRNKIVLHAGTGKSGTILGYIGKDNRTVFDVPDCPLAQNPINDLLAQLRDKPDFLSSLAPKSSVTFRYTKHDGAIFWVDNQRIEPSRITVSSKLGNITVPRRSFFQVNTGLADLVILRVMEMIKECEPKFLVDAFCGVGVFSLAAFKAGVREVFGIDSDSRAVRAAKSNVMELSKGSFAQFAGRSALPGLQELPPHIDPAKTMLILDPPRSGLEENLVQYLSSVRPTDIVYISCAADTLARDVSVLCKAGYKVKTAQIFDMFPRTAYFESVLWLKSGKID